jgi:hypothetical protein
VGGVFPDAGSAAFFPPDVMQLADHGRVPVRPWPNHLIGPAVALIIEQLPVQVPPHNLFSSWPSIHHPVHPASALAAEHTDRPNWQIAVNGADRPWALPSPIAASNRRAWRTSRSKPAPARLAHIHTRNPAKACGLPAAARQPGSPHSKIIKADGQTPKCQTQM